MKIFGYLSFWGKNFSPSRARTETSVTFTKENEVGEIGKSGKYKLKPYDYGSASIDFEWNDNDGSFLVPIELLNLLKLHKEKFHTLGAEEIQIFVTIAYQNQCNLEFDPAFMKAVADLGIPLLLSCYEDNE